MRDEPERLWDAEDLARFLGLALSTVLSMTSRCPDRLPPRVAALHAPRWLPSVVLAWAEKQSGPTRRKGGRPRRQPSFAAATGNGREPPV